MNIKKDNKFQWGVTAFLVIAAGISFYYLMFHGYKLKEGINVFTRILRPVVYGFITAYLLTPVLNFVEYHILIPLFDRLKIKKSSKRSSFIRGLGILISIFLLCALIYTLVYMILSQIIPSVINLIGNFDTYANNFKNWTDKVLSDYPDIGNFLSNNFDTYSVELESWMNEFLITRTSGLIKTVSISAINILKILWNLIIGFIISMYLLASKEKFAGQVKKITYALFKQDTANIIINNFRFTHKTFIGFIGGKIIDSIIIGMLCFIGTSVMKTPYAALVSVIIGVTNIIPFFGPYLGAIPCAILIFIVDLSHPLNCLYFVLFILVLQQFDGNILGPRILGESTGLAGFWVIFAITFFGGIYGVFGMIIGVPIFAVIYAAIKSFINTRLLRKNMSLATADYMTVGAIDEDGYHEFIPDYRLKKEERNKSPYGKNFVCNSAELKQKLFDSKKSTTEETVTDGNHTSNRQDEKPIRKRHHNKD